MSRSSTPVSFPQKFAYDDGIGVEYRPGHGWIGEDGDAESTADRHRVTLPAGSIAHLEESLMIAAARVVAASAAKVEFSFGPNTRVKFTGRTVGAGTTVEWLEVQLRVERPNYGEALPIAHLCPSLQQVGETHPQFAILRSLLAFFQSIRSAELVGLRDPHADSRKSLADRVACTALAWALEDAAKAHGGSPVEK